MNAKQFAWLYLIENGQAGMSPSYYGGYNPVQELKEKFSKMSWDKQWSNPFKAQFIDAIKKYGVNWDATSAPESTLVHLFQGTFADSKQEELIEGTLVLCNGRKQYWSADKVQIGNVFEMMAGAAEAIKRGTELFNIECDGK